MSDHWLARPETIRKLWIVFIAILALTVVAELFIKRKAYFGFDEIFGFYAWGELGPIAGEFGGLPCMYQQHTFVSAVLTEEK